MRILLTLTICCAMIAIGKPAGADESKTDALTAQELLNRMARVYADCKTYRDTGVVKTVFHDKLGKRTTEKPFKTAFVRPERFRFKYTEELLGRKDRYIVWRDGKEVQTWWDIRPGVEKKASLGLALAGATGVSGSSAHTVPALLMPKEVGGRRLTDITEAKRIEDAKLDEAECFRVEGKLVNSPMTIWIDKKTFLVRRIDSTSKFDDFSTETTTTYDPIIDEEVPDEALEFDPPKEE